jgi:hypothetical protein
VPALLPSLEAPAFQTLVTTEEVRFARDSPLEGDGFELPVPRERDLNLTLCRTAGTVSSNKSEVRARSAMPIRVGLNALFHDKRLSNPSPA